MICSGLDPDGLAISTPTSVSVEPGAEVRRGALGASIVATSSLYSNTSSLTVDGLLTDGVLVQAGVGGSTPNLSTTLFITNKADGQITGTTAINLVGSSSGFAWATAAVDNAGLIASASGAALTASNSSSGFTSIVNRDTGFIGGIDGSFSTITNSGTIEGGAASAIHAALPPTLGLTSPQSLTNSGTIRSAGSAGTVDVAQPGFRITNSGTIGNLGTGQAIFGGDLSITNNAGASIATAGSVAIGSNVSVNLTNRGVITGSIMVTPGSSGSIWAPAGSIIDSTGGGKILGNVTLGAGNDTIVAGYDDGVLNTGITGALDAGSGTDTLRIDFHADQTISAAIPLPTTVEALAFKILDQTTVTLASGFSTPSTIHITDGSSGTLVNQADLITSGPAIVTDFFTGVLVDNRGSITATLANSADSAVQLNAYASLANSGSIDARGGAGVYVGYGNLTNSGTITADSTGVTLFGGASTNSGTISSRGGAGVIASGSAGESFTNSGLIEGATSGAQVNFLVVNSGTIQGGVTGVALDPYGTLYNQAGGVVTGGTNGVAASQTYGFTFNSSVQNAGTINGNVDLGSFPSGYYGSSNIYVSLPGGILNGNLNLGSGNDTFVTDLVNNGTGEFAGVTGTVTGGGTESIRYRVNEDASATVTRPGIFSIVGYELSNDAALTLTASGPQNMGLLFAGNGSVDLTADLSTSNGAIISTTTAIRAPGDMTAPSASAVNIVSHGTLTFTPGASTYVAAIVLGSRNDSFTNAGTINIVASASGTANNFAIYGGQSITNSGTINVADGTAVFNAERLINSGTISQIAGTSGGHGILEVTDIANSGTISVDGDAITLNYSGVRSQIDNKGVIASGTGNAVVAPFVGVDLNNEAGGTISAGTGKFAVALGGGSTVINSGTINGDVNLAYGGTGSSSYGSSAYISDGTLNGNLTFGAGNDLFIQRGTTTGVSGTIDAGGGFDIFGRSLAANGSLAIGGALPDGFEGELVEARGATTVVTLTGSADGSSRDLYLAGDGSFVNQADIDGSVTTNLPFFGNALSGAGTLASFANSGSIGSADLGGAVLLSASDRFTFSNSGTIFSSNFKPYYPYVAAVYLGVYAASAISLNNSGTIDGGLILNATLAAGSQPATVDITNDGSISAASQWGRAVTANIDTSAAGGSLSINNSGTIGATGASGTAVAVSVGGGNTLGITIANSGTINASGLAGTGLSIIDSTYQRSNIAITNSGTIEANGGGVNQIYSPTFFNLATAVAVEIYTGTGTTSKLTNQEDGTLAATGPNSTAVLVLGSALTLDNAGTISGGSGVSLPANANASGYLPDNYLAGAVQTGGGDDVVKNSGTITGSIDLGAGNDRIANYGTITGDVFLRGGDDVFVELLSGHFSGTADGGAGVNTLMLDITGGGNPPDFTQFVNFQNLALTGIGTIPLTGMLPFPTVHLNGGNFTLPEGASLSTTGPVALTGSDAAETVVNHGTIGASVALGGGDDRFDNYGAVTGTIDLGDGNDIYAAHGGSVTGDLTSGVKVDGGAGTNRLEIHSAGTDANPVAFALDGYVHFQQLDQAEGVTALSGNVGFDGIMVSGGRLIGLAGSTITAPQGIGVAAGATFGSAGRVFGNIAVAGTLSPGASPGTMMVTGNVALASGSNALFELTPTVSDKLVIDGTLTIAKGATLTLTASQPLRPGTTLTLIDTTGGIAGAFTTVNRGAGVFGFLNQTADSLELIGQFLGGARYTPQANATIDYVNSLLVAGTTSEALNSALPTLLTANGDSNVAAFARINPEAYASAEQIGVENGLAIANAGRSATLGKDSSEPGFFSFGQFLGNSRKLGGNAAIGTSSANIQDYGMLGGMGYGTTQAAFGVFAGYLNAQQGIDGLGASTKADGFVAGAQARLARKGFDLSALVAFNGSTADTRRVLPGGQMASGHYNLHGWTADASAGYRFAIGAGGWALHPAIGVTYVSSRRGAVAEQGSSVFALDVDARTIHATFGDASLAFEAPVAAPVRPWINAGVRHQFDGEQSFATGGFVGTDTVFMVTGAGRRDTLATLGAGLNVTLGKGVMFLGYRGEFGDGGGSQGGNIGFRLAF